MIQFNTSLELLKKFVIEHGEISNWNYAESLLVKNILIHTDSNDKYKVVMIRYYKSSDKYYYTDQNGDVFSCDYITKWCSITV